MRSLLLLSLALLLSLSGCAMSRTETESLICLFACVHLKVKHESESKARGDDVGADSRKCAGVDSTLPADC
jgi:hypothetical protein